MNKSKHFYYLIKAKDTVNQGVNKTRPSSIRTQSRLN